MSYSNRDLLEVQDIGPDHRGLYATRHIPAGTLLGFFDGRAAVADLGADGRGQNLDDFFWRQSVHLKRDGNTLYYLIPYEQPDGIDYLNHSCHPNAHVEQQLYSGGFISNADATTLERFHQVAPEQKLQVVGTIRDARLTYLAERLIYEEWPTVLPLETRERIDAELQDRHLALTECSWTTVSAALEEIGERLPDAVSEVSKELSVHV